MAGLSLGGGKNKSKSSSTTTNPYAEQQYNTAVSTLGNKSYTPLTGAQIQGYESPYQSQVINAFNASNEQARQMAQNGNTDQAISQGAFGGSREGVAQALTNGQYDLNSANFSSNLLNQGYNTALQTAQTENAAANQYPLAIQQLLGQLAQGTKQNTTGKGTSTSLSAGWSA